MAKTSAIQRNLKRIKLSKKYAKKRMALKKIIKDKKTPIAERFAAQLKLNKLPKYLGKTLACYVVVMVKVSCKNIPITLFAYHFLTY